MEQLFEDFIQLGYFDAAEYMYNHYNNQSKTRFDLSDMFLYGCKHNRLNVVKWICNLPISGSNFNIDDLDDYTKFDIAMKICCANGHLEMLQFIYTIYPSKINNIDYILFYESCKNGQLLIAQWLMSIYDFSYFHLNYLAYNEHRTQKHKHMIKWLQSQMQSSLSKV